jgi:hypothetical protein
MSHKKYRAETNCLNCGAEVAGKFCSNCGQENLETRENFLHLAGHFISDYFHFDSKFFRSLIPLFFKPGFLTKQYWEGKRVSYIHPLRLFFFITILFMISATVFYGSFDVKLKEAIKSQAIIQTPNDSITDKAEREKADSEDKKKVIEMSKGLSNGIDSFFNNLKYMSFLLLPLYAVIFQIVYFRRKTFYVDHLVYTLHLQSFAYCLFGLLFFLVFLFPDWLGALRRGSMFIIFLYTIFSLRLLYHQPWWKTIFKSLVATVLLVFTTGVSLGIYIGVYLTIKHFI